MIHKVDIAICTWNRDSLLAQTLNSVLQLSIPESVSVSVLIVDNNSTDHTQSVIDSFVSTAGDQLSVVGLKEAQQGHTFSRNKAIESATGDLMLWTDDDVILPTNWIEAYVAAANQFANSVFWGSVIEPKFQEGPASWITENWNNLKGCFAHRDLGAESIEFTTERLPYGANFAIRTQTQKEFLYSTNLGRRGDAVLGEDELELFRRVAIGFPARSFSISFRPIAQPRNMSTTILSDRGERWLLKENHGTTMLPNSNLKPGQSMPSTN